MSSYIIMSSCNTEISFLCFFKKTYEKVPRPGIESEPQVQPLPMLQLWQYHIPHPTASGQGWKPHLLSDLSHCSQILFFFFFFLSATPMTYRSFQARGRIRAAVASLCHSHSNARSKQSLPPTPQLRATPDLLTH